MYDDRLPRPPPNKPSEHSPCCSFESSRARPFQKKETPMLLKKAWCVCVLLLTYSSIARADDACTTIAKQGLYDTHVTKSSTQTFSQFRSNFCSWYSSYRESHNSASAGATIPIADIPIGLN